jgi:dTDP-4-dehydrorhamnose reductase
MRVFVTGVAGQLGHDCVIELEKRGHRSIGSDISPVPSYLPSRTEPHGVDTPDPSYVQLDITNEQLVKRTIEELKPDVIIHCAAWTAVDAAEDPGNKDKVHKINAEGTAYIAEAAKAVDAKMVYISTDYVFDGHGERPWQPDDKDYAPLNYYGQTKLEGEMAVAENLDKYFIVRIAWVFGLNGKNFIKTMINVGKTHDTVAQQQASHQRLQL